jgi:nucleoid DNA-binding protein
MENVVEKLAAKHEISKKAAKELVLSVLDIIQTSVAAGETVRFIGFGTFEKVAKKERTSFNPASKKLETYPATTVPKFKPGSKFKAAVKA